MTDPKAEGEELGGVCLGKTAEGQHVFHVMSKKVAAKFAEAGYDLDTHVLVDDNKKPTQTAVGYTKAEA